MLENRHDLAVLWDIRVAPQDETQLLYENSPHRATMGV
jgi:hypothetical protein